MWRPPSPQRRHPARGRAAAANVHTRTLPLQVPSHGAPPRRICSSLTLGPNCHRARRPRPLGVNFHAVVALSASGRARSPEREPGLRLSATPDSPADFWAMICFFRVGRAADGAGERPGGHGWRCFQRDQGVEHPPHPPPPRRPPCRGRASAAPTESVSAGPAAPNPVRRERGSAEFAPALPPRRPARAGAQEVKETPSLTDATSLVVCRCSVQRQC